MTQPAPVGYFNPGPNTGAGNYAANAPIAQSYGTVFGSVDPGQTPFLGGSPQALDQYLAQQQGQQSNLQQAAMAAQGTLAPQQQYGNTLAGQVAPGGLAHQYQQAYSQAQSSPQLQAMAAGTAPSAAEIQQNQGISAATRAGLSAAASTRGGAGMQAAAMQQAQANGANLQAQGIGAAAQMRLQEQQQAQGLLAQNNQAMLGAAGQQQALATQQAGANQSAQLQQYGLNNQMQLGLGLQSLGYGQLGLSAQQSQLGAQTAQNQINMQASQAASQADTQFATGIMGAAGSVLGALSDIRAKADVQPVKPGAHWQVQTGQAQMDPRVQVQMGAPVMDPAPKPAGLSKADALAFLKGGSLPTQTAPQPMAQAQPLVSDERAKSSGGEATHVADAYLDHLAKSAATYSYKDPSQAPAAREPGAKFGGVMAQDLQNVPEIGPQLVSDTPQGKTLEGGANLSAALMGLGRLHERLRALEGRK